MGDGPSPGSAGEALARYYDLDVQGELDDVDLYVALAARHGDPILELAAGSGRVAVPLAAAGHRVTGVDTDRHMLARADRRWQEARLPGARSPGDRPPGDLELVEADITRLDLGRRFRLVILALNTLLLLPGREAQAAVLAVVARHLAPGGRAVIDTWLPTPDDLALYDGRTVLDWLRTDPVTGDNVAKHTSARFEPATGRATVTTVFDSWPPDGGPVSRVARQDQLHFMPATEVVSLATAAGLAVETLAGDHSMTPFGPGSERVVVVCALL